VYQNKYHAFNEQIKQYVNDLKAANKGRVGVSDRAYSTLTSISSDDLIDAAARSGYLNGYQVADVSAYFGNNKVIAVDQSGAGFANAFDDFGRIKRNDPNIKFITQVGGETVVGTASDIASALRLGDDYAFDVNEEYNPYLHNRFIPESAVSLHKGMESTDYRNWDFDRNIHWKNDTDARDELNNLEQWGETLNIEKANRDAYKDPTNLTKLLLYVYATDDIHLNNSQLQFKNQWLGKLSDKDLVALINQGIAHDTSILKNPKFYNALRQFYIEKEALFTTPTETQVQRAGGVIKAQ
jgi:hypothetical protein